MKKTILLLFLSINIFSQNPKVEYENFYLQEDKSILWQKIYEIKASKDSIVNFIKAKIQKNDFINKLKYNNYSFNGTSNFSKIKDLKRLPIATHQEFNSFVSIDVKDNKYRITIKKVKFKPITIDVGMVEVATDFTLEEIVVRNKKHEIRKNKTARSVLVNLNKTLLNLVDLNKKEKTNKNW